MIEIHGDKSLLNLHKNKKKIFRFSCKNISNKLEKIFPEFN